MKTLSVYLKETAVLVEEYHAAHPLFPLEPAEFMEGAYAYFSRGGKRLRPAILRLSAGVLGGKDAENAALPAALGIEFYHNWTLIHDDVIDHDATRRGKPSVHAATAAAFSDAGAETAAEYGTDIAILAGDALHSAAIAHFASLSDSGKVRPEVALKILSLLEGNYGLRLLNGETIDTKNGLLYGKNAFWKIPESEVIGMMAGKTGALFAIAALAGALIGQNSPELTPEAKALSAFAEHCGVAFQLQDDILGLTADEEKLGKPILSDLREGKPTVLLLRAYKKSSEEEKAFLRRTVGQSRNPGELLQAREILLKNGGVSETEKLAAAALEKARAALSCLPDSSYKSLLAEWCEFMLDRKY